MTELHQDIQEIFFSQEQIAQRVAELGAELERDYRGKKPIFVCILRGSFVFMADIVRACPIPCEVAFMAVSSYYDGSTSSGVVTITQDIDLDMQGRDIILIEDILDSGNTLAFLRRNMLERGVASVSICTLLNKPSRRTRSVQADYIGFEVADEFVVGYGLDYQQRYRNLPYIGVLKPGTI